MTYDPFSRGPHPVGVRTALLHDASRAGRRVDVELWYPAAASHAGKDISPQLQDRYSLFGSLNVSQDALREATPAAGSFPLLVFSHGMAGHRRQSTFYCTLLASHGYLVVSPDHGGSTLADLMSLAMRVRSHELPDDVESMLEGYVFDRPRDVTLILDALESGALAAPTPVDTARVGVTGHSFGGYTALVCAARDPRVATVMALAPAGGDGPLSSQALRRELTLDFAGRKVASLYLALGADTLLPLRGIEQLYARTPPPSRLFTLPHADHMHFCDRAESSHEFFRALPPLGVYGDLLRKIPPFAQLVPASHGQTFATALGLAHADATLKHDAAAEDFLARRAVSAFAERAIHIEQAGA
jgi:dienelactone hydrolase